MNVWTCYLHDTPRTVFVGDRCEHCGRGQTQSELEARGRDDDGSDWLGELDPSLKRATDQNAEENRSVAPSMLEQLRAQLLDTDGLDSIAPPTPLVPGLLYQDSPAWLFGRPGCGKSFVALDIAGCVATGEQWQGFGPIESGPVLYLVAEGASGIKQRVRAWEASMRRKMTGVHFLPVAVQASNATAWQALVDLAAELKPVLIVVDTQARISVGMEENSNTEMGQLVDRIERLRKSSKACVLTVHHTGRDGDHLRGAVAIDGAATTTIKVEKDQEILTISNPKQKDAPEFDPFRLRLVAYDDSAILSLIHGPLTVDLGQPAVRKMLVEWWDSHETDWVSVSTLVDSKIVTKPTFHRNAKALERQGHVESKGEGSVRRYRLVHKPQL